jgi:hypothetical protein
VKELVGGWEKGWWPPSTLEPKVRGAEVFLQICTEALGLWRCCIERFETARPVPGA